MDEDFALVIMQPSKIVIPRERWLQDLPGHVVHEWRTEERIVRVWRRRTPLRAGAYPPSS